MPASPETDRRDIAPDVLHRVVNGEGRPSQNRRGIDVQKDVTLQILGLEQQQLGTDEVGRRLIDLGAEEDDPFFSNCL